MDERERQQAALSEAPQAAESSPSGGLVPLSARRRAHQRGQWSPIFEEARTFDGLPRPMTAASQNPSAVPDEYDPRTNYHSPNSLIGACI